MACAQPHVSSCSSVCPHEGMELRASRFFSPPFLRRDPAALLAIVTCAGHRAAAQQGPASQATGIPPSPAQAPGRPTA